MAALLYCSSDCYTPTCILVPFIISLFICSLVFEMNLFSN